MDISHIGMGCLYILWTMLSFLIGNFMIERPSDNSYYQYFGVACQTNETHPMENSGDTVTFSEAKERYFNKLADAIKSRVLRSGIMSLQ